MKPLQLDVALSEYLKIPTENPPGNEMPALIYLSHLLEERRLKPTIHTTAPERGVLECSIGPSDSGSIVLLHHVDVVPATEEGWKIPPYSGEIRDGYIWGRGALDMKGQGIMELGAFLALAAHEDVLKKRITYLAVSDEEQGGRFGAKWAVDNLMESLRPELVINEGGGGVKDVLVSGTAFVIEVTQKAGMKLRLVASGTPGHGSTPPHEYATKALVRALSKVMDFRFDTMVTPVILEMFRQMAARIEGIPKQLLDDPSNPAFQGLIEARANADPRIDSMLRTSIALTILKAGDAPNSIPGRAEAVLDIRVLPGHDPAEVVLRIKELVGEYGVSVEASSLPPKPQVSAFDTDYFRILERLLKTEVPDCVVVPTMATGGTDSRFFRDKGVPCYGIMPTVMSAEDSASVHGYNEKISVEGLLMGERVFRRFLEETCL